MRRSLLLALSVATAAVAAGGWWLACRQASRPAPVTSVAEAYDGVAAALTRPGMIAHVVIEREPDPALSASRYEAWLDVAADVARYESDITYEPGAVTERQTYIYRDGARYIAGQGGPNLGCVGASKRILTILANCPGERSETKTRVEKRSFEGTGALAIVTTGSISGIDSLIEINNALFVDPSTFMPLAFESKGTDRYALGGYEQRFHTAIRYRIDFVRREALPAGFFELASIGVPDPEQAIDAAHYVFPIFWPGREYAGDGTAPPLTLSDVPAVTTDRPELGPLILTYSRAGDVFARLLTITQTSAEKARLDAATGSVPEWRRDPCALHEELAVPGAHAVLYRWHVGRVSACSSAAPDGIVLEVDLGDTFVIVLPDISLALANQPNPYASAHALANLALALTRR